MTTVLVILAIGAVIGVFFMRDRGQSVASGAASGALMSGYCMLQLLLPVLFLLAGFWLFRQIFG